MPQITITVDIDDEVGDISLSIDEVRANGVSIQRERTPDLQ